MYTELVLKCEVKADLPEDVEIILNYLFNDRETTLLELPKHKFFTLYRWKMLGSCNSYYHVPWSNSMYNEHYIFSRSDFKNYSNEIEEFIDWISPYIIGKSGTCIGWTWYEEDSQPTLIYKR